MDVKEGHCWRCEKQLPPNFVKCHACPLAAYCSKQCQQQDRVRHGSVECQVFGPKHCSQCGKQDKVKECAGCNNAWYCNAACQQKHWAAHKTQCRHISSFVKELGPEIGQFHSDIGDELNKTADPPAYIGNTIAIDYLQLQGNEWAGLDEIKEEGLKRDYHILSAGCGDLRGTVVTIASLPATYQGKLYITLDDFDPFVMARNVMFLVMMVKYANRDGIASSLATIWYSVHISESDYDLIRTTLEELVQVSQESLYASTQGLVSVEEADVSYLRQVWEGWLRLQCRRNRDDSINLRKQRKSVFARDMGASIGLPKYLNKLTATDSKFMRKWFDHGLFLPEDKRQDCLPFDNLTLTGRPSLRDEAMKTRRDPGIIPPSDYDFVYCINTDSTPFKVWDCLRVREFTTRPDLSVMQRYHAYVTHLIQQSINFVSQERLQVSVFLANCLDFPNHHLTLKMSNYDRIFTSNIADYVGHGKLLKTFKPLLNSNNKHSVIVTQTMNWIQSCTPAADVQNVSWAEVSRYLSMCQEDTGMSRLLAEDVNNHREYYNNTHWFLAYLRADIMGGGIGVPVMDHVPKLNDVMHYHGLQLRDFRKKLNKLVPFQYRVNARKVTMLNGMDRNLEWCLPDNSDEAETSG